jgi:acetyl esterase/lipase
VPIGYLLTVLLMAWCTLFALTPPRPRRSSTSNLSYWFGFLINELPFPAIWWLLASTLLAFGEGDVASPAGWAAFGLAVLTTVGLVVVAWRGLRAAPVVDRALDEGLGAGWRTTVDARRRRRPWARILLWPFPVRPRQVERVANIAYGDAGRWNLLDLYRHRAHPSCGPVLVYLHGGAFRSGGKRRAARPLLYGADPAVVFVAGSSAGGHLAAMAALTANDPAFQPGFEQADTSVAAAVCLYGYYGSLDGRASSSPLAYARADAPPFLVAHGDKDTIVLVEDA